jgi:RNA binding exosome subunit
MTIKHELLDIKLKHLIVACKQTENYKKLAVVGFTLVSNIVDEIALKLGARPREREKAESLLMYMNMVNEIFQKNLSVQIFHDEVVNTIKEVELLFNRNRGDLPLEYIRKIIETYYELRKTRVPNLYKNLTGEGYFDDPNIHLSSTVMRGKKESKFKPILVQKINEQERILQKKLNSHLEQSDFEKAIILRRMKQSLYSERGLAMQGVLKDSIDYRQNYSHLIKFMLIGVALLSLFLGIIVCAEIFMYPLTLPSLSNVLLILLGVTTFIVLVYKNVFRRR